MYNLYNLPIISDLVRLLHWILVTLHDYFSSLGLGEHWTWGLAIIGLTIIVRLILFPLTWKQFKSAQHMQIIQPQLKELQKRYKDNRAKLQEETMKLYQEHRVNPFASCLPLLIQLPVFLALYAAIKGLGPLDAASYQASVDALNSASFLWIPRLGERDPTYILLIVYVASQLVSTELMLTAQTDKMQKMMMRAMPIVFVFFLFSFPAGLFVYWVTTNLWSIGQQLIIRRTMPKPEVLAARAKAKPQKRSRFMEAIMAAQGGNAQQRENLPVRKKSASSSGAAKRSAGAAKQRAGGAAKQSAGAAKSGAGGASKQGAVSAGGKKQASGGRKPPPGKGKHKAGAATAKGQGKPGGASGKAQRRSGGRQAEGQAGSGGAPATGGSGAASGEAENQSGTARD